MVQVGEKQMVVIKGTTREQILKALENTNKKFGNNVVFNRFDQTGKHFNVTLKVKDSHGKGARIGFTGRAMVAACWHVYGVFFDEMTKLNPVMIEIIANGHTKITATNGGNWCDQQVGSLAEPHMYSDMCHCGRGRGLY